MTWVGKVDWELTHFHGDEYSTHRGSSYNSYLRRGPHAALARHDVHLFQRRRRHPLQLGDGFGQHYATESLFNDTVDQAELNYEAMKYYANILTLYSPMVTRKVNEVLALNLPLKMICPSHGVIWKDNPAQIVEKYLAWAAEYQEDRIAIVYDTMWQSTRLMAEAIADGIRSVAPQTEATLLYTLLKVRYCVTGPHSVMWTVDDEIRDETGLLVKEHDGMTDEQWLTRATAVIERIEEMIYKESNIPFFHAQRLTVNGDFYFAERFSAMASPSHAAGSAN